ncbi:protein lin-52 homolog isoform X2 [Drosophila busckii]|uniref:protein lin-52 homolog isoform X2 n=1 Tax=Drosophila busckii TaxID=30019 RepID=UPI00083EA34E|nr:protein lin-52 homolog isoform X2 [Drosophila busckii]
MNQTVLNDQTKDTVTPIIEDEAKEKTNVLSAKEGELMSMETLRESPVQWPKRLPGMDEFIFKSETPIHLPNTDGTSKFNKSSGATISDFARLPPDQLIERIKAMNDQVYQLGLRESREMTRGKLLGIFDQERLTRTRGMRN